MSEVVVVEDELSLVVDAPSSLLLLQEMMVRLKQKIRKTNITFFIFSSIPKVKILSGYETLNNNRICSNLQKCWDFTLRVVSLDWITGRDFGKKFRMIRKEDKLNYKI